MFFMNSDEDIILFGGILIIKLHNKTQFQQLLFYIRQMVIALKKICVYNPWFFCFEEVIAIALCCLIFLFCRG